MLARTLATLAFIAALEASAQITVQGVVRDAADASPISDAHVLAIAGRPRAIVAEARTDSQGRYRLEASEPRFELTVEAVGYFVVRADDVEADSVARVCPQAGDCGEANFVLTRAAVLEGWITDMFGNAQQSVEIELKPNSPTRPAEPGNQRLIGLTEERNRNEMTSSDDRGYFRLWGFRPGAYTLTTRRSGTRYIGMPDPPQITRVVEIPASEDSVRLNLQLTDAPQTFSFSGQIEGLKPGDKRWLSLQPIDGGNREIVQVTAGKFASVGDGFASYRPAKTEADGSFRASVPPGN